MSFLNTLGADVAFTSICGLATICSFILTIYVSLKTKLINKRIQALRDGKNYNESKNSMKESLVTYQKLLRDDTINIISIKDNVLNDINASYIVFNNILDWREKRTYRQLIKELNKSQDLDLNLICNLISKIYAYLESDKEEF